MWRGFGKGLPLDRYPAWIAGEHAESDCDDLTLVRLAQVDPSMFGSLYQRYLPRIYRYIRTRSITDDEAADLAQQVFLNALAALPRYRTSGPPFPAWLFRIAHNLVIDANRQRRPDVPWEHTRRVRHLVDDADLEGEFLRQESLASLRKLLARLEQDKRDLLALRFAAGLSSREIASVVGKREAAVKKQLARTIHRLKEQYDAELPSQ